MGRPCRHAPDGDEHVAGPARCFAHYSNISGNGYRELVEGEPVTFDITQGQKGPQAENIVHG
ncbi:cold shock domain-containing protein [Streptomyces lavendulocolor]|uniref:cold shock domain-containing protein n=1 Tax=Streptomyces lavendulocolor TaxID=67316 RepID=UPI003C2F4D76